MPEPVAELAPELLAKLDRLRAILDSFARVAVAYSGGVDSSLVYAVAHDRLGDRAVALTAVSRSLPRSELEAARELARRIGGRHVLLDSQELNDPRYAANSPRRCYFCKQEAYHLLTRWAGENGFEVVMDGSNLDDAFDTRPGRQAAAELRVTSPLQEAELTKPEVRALARARGLPNWNKPSMACLASRIPYGTPITPPLLSRIESAEEVLHALGIAQVRVRHHGTVARLEVEPADFPRLIAAREEVVAKLRELGYAYVSLDLTGYRTGSLNDTMKSTHESPAPALHPE